HPTKKEEADGKKKEANKSAFIRQKKERKKNHTTRKNQEGRPHNHPRHKSHFQVEIERFSRIEVNQLLRHPIGMQGRDDGLLHDLVNSLRVCPAGEESNRHRDERVDDPAPQFLEVFEKTHSGHFVVGLPSCRRKFCCHLRHWEPYSSGALEREEAIRGILPRCGFELRPQEA